MNASARITHHIDELADSRGETLAQLRRLVLDAAPELVEEWKWNTPVWSRNGNVLAVGAFGRAPARCGSPCWPAATAAWSRGSVWPEGHENESIRQNRSLDAALNRVESALPRGAVDARE
jgi:hypothetical protein